MPVSAPCRLSPGSPGTCHLLLDHSCITSESPSGGVGPYSAAEQAIGHSPQRVAIPGGGGARVCLGTPSMATPADIGGRHVRIDSPCLATPNTTPKGRARATRGGQLPDAWASGGTSARLDRHQALLERQQVQIDVLREEAAVLRDCLTRAGSMSMDHFLVCLHRQRFASVQRAHPICSDTDLVQSLGARELVTAVARNAGPPAVHALRAASVMVNQVVSDVLPILGPLFSNCLYVCGGFDGTEESLSTAERFDPLAGVWEPLPPMHERRSMMGAAVVAGQLCVCGGHDGSRYGRRALNSAERFNPAATVWEPLPPMLERRLSAACVVLGGWLYMCGGFDGERSLASTERLDPTAAAWEPQPPMADSREGPAAAVLGSSLYVCGGSCLSEYIRSCEHFDLAAGVWKLIPSMTELRGHAAAASLSGMLYVCGGCDSHQRHSSAERFEPGASSWELLPAMATCRLEPAVAVVAGRIYVCGGRDGVRFLSSAERFDPVSGQWKALRPMSARRGAAAAAVLDGRLYVCGGHDGAEFRRSVERFDPESGSWELLPPMRSRRSSASAVALWSFAPHWLLDPPTLGPALPPAPLPPGSSAGGLALGGVGPLPGEFGGHAADADAEAADAGEFLPTPPSMLGTPT